MEKQLGETFIHNGLTLQVSEVENTEIACSGCYFWEHNLCCYGNGLDCTDDARKDHRNVIFKLKKS